MRAALTVWLQMTYKLMRCDLAVIATPDFVSATPPPAGIHFGANQMDILPSLIPINHRTPDLSNSSINEHLAASGRLTCLRKH